MWLCATVAAPPPCSVHMSGDDQELSELQEMLRRPDLTNHERKWVFNIS